MANEQNGTVTGIATQVAEGNAAVSGVMDIVVGEDGLGGANADLGAIEGHVILTDMQIMMNMTDLNEVAVGTASQTILSDYFTRNEDPIMLAMGSTIVGSFSLC